MNNENESKPLIKLSVQRQNGQNLPKMVGPLCPIGVLQLSAIRCSVASVLGPVIIFIPKAFGTSPVDYLFLNIQELF